MLTLSLIIPVYNEERHIGHCLDAVAKQTVMPDEVIIVDNNCSDKTIEIARRYDFVTVVKQPEQGIGHARSKGFDAASGDILGRIDADVKVKENWVERVKHDFESYDQLAGLTGIARSIFLPGVSFLKSTIPARGYFWFVHAQFNTVTMWGANMAIRREWWDKVRDDVCLDDKKVHEDQDISLWMVGKGARIGVDNDLRVDINGQSYRYLPKSLHYTALFQKTYNYHKKMGNLNGEHFHALGFLRTLPGRIMSVPVALYSLVLGVLFFPIDYIVYTFWPNSWWLD